MNKTFWKGAFCLLVLFAYLIGTATIIGYNMYIGDWATVVGVLLLAAMSFPTVRCIWDAWRRL